MAVIYFLDCLPDEVEILVNLLQRNGENFTWAAFASADFRLPKDDDQAALVVIREPEADAGSLAGLQKFLSPGWAVILLSDRTDGAFLLDAANLGFKRVISRQLWDPYFAACVRSILESREDLGLESGMAKKGSEPQDELEGLNQRLAEIIWQSPNLLAIVNNSGRILYINKAGRHILGIEKDGPLVEINFIDWLPAEEISHFYDALKIAEREGIWRGEGRVLLHGDHSIPVSAIVLTHQDENGKVVLYSVIVIDVSAAKNIENELRKSQELLARLLSVSPTVVYSFEVNPPYRSIAMSANINNVCGYENVQFQQDPTLWLRLVHPDDLVYVEPAIELAFKNSSWSAEYRFQHKDGHYVWIRENLILLRDPEGLATEILGYCQDITAQLTYEENLRRSEERYRLLAEAAQDYIFVFSPSGRIEYANQLICKLLGKPLEEIIGADYQSLISGRSEITGLEGSINGLESEIPIYLENKIKLGQKEIWLGTNLVPVRDASGKVVSILGVARDITQRQQVVEELKIAYAKEKELSELRSRFVSLTSHEFRNPLSTILSSAELLENYGAQWSLEKRKEHLQRIQGAAKRINRIMTGILDIARSDAGKLELSMQELDLLRFLNNVVEEARLIDHQNHEIHLHANTAECRVFLDETYLRQVFENLLSNTFKYSPTGSVVDIEVTCSERAVQIAIADRGIGIRDEDLAQLFEPFFRGSNVGDIPGTGLGLPIAKRWIEEMHGQITVESQLGLGTKFVVTLPLVENEDGS